MLLARKLVRELRRRKGQSLAVLVVTALGVLLFVASAGAYLDLRDSYAATCKKLALADLHVAVTSADADSVAKVKALPGVRAVEPRTVTSLPVEIGEARVELRLLSLTSALDRVLVTTGRLPASDGEILVEKHLAQYHRLSVGSRIRAADRTLTVSGIGVSAEYLWVSRNDEDIMPSPESFGVAWMRRDDRVAANQLLIMLDPGVAPAEIQSRLAKALGPALVSATPIALLPGIRLLQMDLDGYRGMAAFFPLLFLGVGAFIVAALLARLVDGERALIGTFLALGLGRGRVLAHYLGYAVVLGGAGALLGAAAGVAAAPALTGEYAVELGIPFVTAVVRWRLAVEGLLLGAGVAALAAAVPALHAARLHPAEAMRPPRPSTGPLARAARHLHAALPIRMALRDVLGRPLRSLGTVLGVAAALLLVLTTGATLDSMRATITALFQDARRYDLRVDFVAPEPLGEVQKRLGGVSGVERMEGLIALPVELHAGARSVSEVLLQGLADQAQLLRSADLDGHEVAPGERGIVLTRAVASRLEVRVGDEVTARLPAGSEARLRVSGFADATLGKTASARREDVARAFGLDGKVTSAAVTLRPGGAQAARRAFAGARDVAHVEDLAEMRDQIRTLMGFGWLMMLAMLFFSVVLAAAILFNTATIGILERRRELATLRALGRTLREIGIGLTLEHALLCLVGFAVGLPVAVVAIRRVLALYSNDLFRFPFVLSPATVAIAASGIIAVLLVAQWPALRQVGRDSLAEAVRSREG